MAKQKRLPLIQVQTRVPVEVWVWIEGQADDAGVKHSELLRDWLTMMASGEKPTPSPPKGKPPLQQRAASSRGEKERARQ